MKPPCGCGCDVVVFGHTSCELGQPIRPPWTIQPSSAPPERSDDEVMRAIYRNVPPPAGLPPRPRRRRLLGRNTR